MMCGWLFDRPDVDLLPACAPQGRRHLLEAHHRPHLVGERQPSQLAPADLLGGEQGCDLGVHVFHWFHLSSSLCRVSTSCKYL